MENIDYVALSKSRYTDQFDYDPTFNAIVQTLIEYKMRVQGLYINFADTILDIEKSTGKNLDLIGSIVGQERVLVDYYANPFFGFDGNPKAEPFDKGLWYSLFSDSGGDSRILTDEEYRRVIKARIIRNKTNCTRKDFTDILDLLLGINRDRVGSNIFQNSLYDLGSEPFPSEFNVAVEFKKVTGLDNKVITVSYKPSASGTFPVIGVKSEFDFWNLRITSGKKYTFVCKVASSTGKLDGVSIYPNNGENNQRLQIGQSISKVKGKFTQIVHVFESEVDTIMGDLLMGIQSNSISDWLEFTDLMLIEGETKETDWKPSYHSEPSYELASKSHGNIDLTFEKGFSSDFVTYFLSKMDDLDSLIPRPLGYKLNVHIRS